MTETMREFTAGRFTVIASIEPDYDCDTSFDETGETQRNIDSGLWQCFCTKVAVYLDGHEIAADYLGGSIYADPSDFFTEHVGLAAKSRADGCNYGAYFPDMVRTAISEARDYVRRTQPAPRVRNAEG